MGIERGRPQRELTAEEGRRDTERCVDQVEDKKSKQITVENIQKIHFPLHV